MSAGGGGRRAAAIDEHARLVAAPVERAWDAVVRILPRAVARQGGAERSPT